MTLQDDIARSWFQPSVPTQAPPQERARPAQHDAASPTPAGQRTSAGPSAASPSANGGNAGPLTTRVAGELPLDDPRSPEPGSLAPRSPDAAPGAERVEVTQPYIPAIREHEPSFAKRPHPAAPAAPESAAPTAMTPAPTPTPAPTELPTRDAGPGAVTAPTEAVTAPRKETPAERPTATSTSANPPKRRSLARRVVRAIIGPDLLRKDPPKKK